MKYFVLDVDGVMTTGQFLYNEDGKAYKVFGPHDSDGLKMVRDVMDVQFITADKRGFAISKKRITDDMGYELEVVGEAERFAFFEKLGLDEVIYMGDGFHDAKVLRHCAYGIAPANGRIEARNAADYVTPSNSGEGAVLDACLEILKQFFPEKHKEVLARLE
ncbi:HAD hydrolase family protein [Candidatus Woesearchaeota archaeon]|nr:HAD hydrolase family protein [Candidatus Woesearchaeota archaeon]